MKPQLTAAALGNRFSRRSFVIGGVQGGIGLLLAARMGYIAVAENEKYEMQAESNRVNLSLIPPRRGWILDRNGNPLASNRADFRVDVIPEWMKEPEKTVAQLGDILGLDAATVSEVQQRVKTAVGAQPVEVASGLNYDQFAAVSVRIPDLHGVVPQRVLACETLTGSDLKAFNTFDAPRRVAPQALPPPTAGGRMTLALPARSYTVVHLGL